MSKAFGSNVTSEPREYEGYRVSARDSVETQMCGAADWRNAVAVKIHICIHDARAHQLRPPDKPQDQRIDLWVVRNEPRVVVSLEYPNIVKIELGLLPKSFDSDEVPALPVTRHSTIGVVELIYLRHSRLVGVNAAGDGAVVQLKQLPCRRHEPCRFGLPEEVAIVRCAKQRQCSSCPDTDKLWSMPPLLLDKEHGMKLETVNLSVPCNRLQASAAALHDMTVDNLAGTSLRSIRAEAYGFPARGLPRT